MTDQQPSNPACPGTLPAGGGMSRRTVVRGAGTVAWTAPLIVAVSAAPASAVVSGGVPAVAVTEATGIRRTAFGGTVDCGITFANQGPVDATALSVVVEFAVAVPGTPVTYGVDDVETPWTSSTHTVTPGGFRVTFTRAGGLAAATSDTLRFTINSAMGTGNIIVTAPTTTPIGANTGGTGVWGDEAVVDMDMTSVTAPNNNGNIFVNFRNNGLVTAPTQTVAMTITPTSGTFSYTNAGDDNPELYSVSPETVAATSEPVTIEFTSVLPLDPGGSKAFSFFIGRTGTGTFSATVTSPTSANNNTFDGTYL